MQQIANQVRHVAIVYVTQIRSWVWVLAVILLVVILLGVFSSEESIQSVISYAFFYAIFFGNWIVDQGKYQFAHSRSRLMPDFAPAHLAVPIGFILAAAVALPALLAAIRQIDPLPYAAAASIAMACVLLGQFFPRLGWAVVALIMLAILLPNDSRHGIDFSSFRFGPTLNITLLLLGWLGIGFYFFKVCRLADDDAVFQRFRDETQDVPADGEGQTPAQFRSFSRGSYASHRWLAKIGGFHEFRRTRVIRCCGTASERRPSKSQPLATQF